jgi:hypothetical protein
LIILPDSNLQSIHQSASLSLCPSAFGDSSSTIIVVTIIIPIMGEKPNGGFELGEISSEGKQRVSGDEFSVD